MAGCLQNLAERKLTFTTSGRYALPETNSSHLKIGGWAVVGKMTFPLGRPIFGTFASFREGNDLKKEVMVCSDAINSIVTFLWLKFIPTHRLMPSSHLATIFNERITWPIFAKIYQVLLPY